MFRHWLRQVCFWFLPFDKIQPVSHFVCTCVIGLLHARLSSSFCLLHVVLEHNRSREIWVNIKGNLFHRFIMLSVEPSRSGGHFGGDCTQVAYERLSKSTSSLLSPFGPYYSVSVLYNRARQTTPCAGTSYAIINKHINFFFCTAPLSDD